MDTNDITNYYACECGCEWELHDCDSMHNDRCPECDTEMTPYRSVSGEVVVGHKKV